MKVYSILSRLQEQEPYHQMLFTVMLRTFFFSLERSYTVSVFKPHPEKGGDLRKIAIHYFVWIHKNENCDNIITNICVLLFYLITIIRRTKKMLFDGQRYFYFDVIEKCITDAMHAITDETNNRTNNAIIFYQETQHFQTTHVGLILVKPVISDPWNFDSVACLFQWDWSS